MINLKTDPRSAILMDLKADEAELENNTAKVLSINLPQSFNLAQAIIDSDVSIDELIQEPPKCLSIRNSDGSQSTIATLGNISLNMGKAKSKKSFFLQLSINATLCQNESDGILISTLPPDKRTIVVIDTEQGRYRSQKILKRAKGSSITGILKVYDLREYSSKERMDMVERIITTTPNLGMVFIDGIRDLVTSINDEEQASFITHKLLQWTQRYQIHIMVVLHQNKGDQNARGHLGTELLNKVETVISIAKDSDDESLSIVTNELARNREFQPFAFRITDEGLPELVDEWEKAGINKLKPNSTAWKPEDIPREIHLKALRSIWSYPDAPKLKYAVLFDAMEIQFLDKCGLILSKDRKDKIYRYYLQEKLITKQGTFYSLTEHSKGS